MHIKTSIIMRMILIVILIPINRIGFVLESDGVLGVVVMSNGVSYKQSHVKWGLIQTVSCKQKSLSYLIIDWIAALVSLAVYRQLNPK